MLLVLLSLLLLLACAHTSNYTAPAGPRYAGGVFDAPFANPVRVATLNLHYALHIDRALELLRTDPQLKKADILCLQEMDPASTRRLAEGLAMNFIYYPAVLHPVTGRDFGNAVLSRWPLRRDRKIILPFLGSTRGSQRIAVAATVAIPGHPIRIYDLHLATVWELSPEHRRDQVRAVLVDAQSSPDPVILAGDFNGPGIGNEIASWGYVWPTRGLGPTVTILDADHVFLRGFARHPAPRAGRVLHNLGASDHLPVWVEASVVD
jgi:endonuclease/exonuclease/phosphatase family metal-dependent hydrolase